jgi:hypothetical protein
MFCLLTKAEHFSTQLSANYVCSGFYLLYKQLYRSGICKEYFAACLGVRQGGALQLSLFL